jgi:hypothetical protein
VCRFVCVRGLGSSWRTSGLPESCVASRSADLFEVCIERRTRPARLSSSSSASGSPVARGCTWQRLLSLWPRPWPRRGDCACWCRACGATPCAGGVPAPGASQRRRRSRDHNLFLLQTAHLNKYSAIYLIFWTASPPSSRLWPRPSTTPLGPRQSAAPLCCASCALCSVPIAALAGGAFVRAGHACCVCVRARVFVCLL